MLLLLLPASGSGWNYHKLSAIPVWPLVEKANTETCLFVTIGNGAGLWNCVHCKNWTCRNKYWRKHLWTKLKEKIKSCSFLLFSKWCWEIMGWREKLVEDSSGLEIYHWHRHEAQKRRVGEHSNKSPSRHAAWFSLIAPDLSIRHIGGWIGNGEAPFSSPTWMCPE